MNQVLDNDVTRSSNPSFHSHHHLGCWHSAHFSCL